jgi:hypothetical protein
MKIAMKTLVIFVTLAVILGVVVMLVPVIAFTYTYHVTVSTDGSNTFGDKDNRSASSGDGFSFEGVTPTSMAEAARTYGAIDTGPTSFPSSLLQTVPIWAIGLVTALVAVFYFKLKTS